MIHLEGNGCIKMLEVPSVTDAIGPPKAGEGNHDEFGDLIERTTGVGQPRRVRTNVAKT